MAQQQYRQRYRNNLRNRFQAAQQALPHQWNPATCRNGAPPGFNDAAAADAVRRADFTDPVYVETSRRNQGRTRYAYTYVREGNYEICVVGHIHLDNRGQWVAGNSFIPGFQGWHMPTPHGHVRQITGLPDGGDFPDDDRFPRRM